MRTNAERYLEESIPNYVDRARKLANYIFERGLNNPSSGIQMQASIYNEPSTQIKIIDPHQIGQMLRTRRRITKMEADAPLDSSRLAIEAPFYSRPETNVYAWVYNTAPYDLASLSRSRLDKENDSHVTETDWVNSSARHYPVNMVTPAYSFHTHSSSPIRYGVTSNFYTRDDRGRMITKFSGGMPVLNTPLAYLKGVVAPRFTKEDIKLLNKSPAEYHINKIERTLAAMAMIAG